MIDQTITILAFLTFFMMACLAAFGIWDEKWFQFGPNDHLTFLKITIDTSGKYILLVTLLIFTYAMKAIGDMYVDPWIKARHVGLISENFTDEWLLIHVILWRIYSWVMLLLFVHVALSQVDIWAIGVVVTILVDIAVHFYGTAEEGFTKLEIKALKKMARRAIV